MKSWKTSITGLALIGAGVYLLMHGQVVIGGTVITAGIGFLNTKDNNVTGGTVQQ